MGKGRHLPIYSIPGTKLVIVVVVSRGLSCGLARGNVGTVGEGVEFEELEGKTSGGGETDLAHVGGVARGFEGALGVEHTRCQRAIGL